MGGLGEARGELIADGPHPQARALGGLPGQLDAREGDFIKGRGRGEGQAQSLVDRRANGAGLRADARPRQQNGIGAVLSARLGE